MLNDLRSKRLFNGFILKEYYGKPHSFSYIRPERLMV